MSGAGRGRCWCGRPAVGQGDHLWRGAAYGRCRPYGRCGQPWGCAPTAPGRGAARNAHSGLDNPAVAALRYRQARRGRVVHSAHRPDDEVRMKLGPVFLCDWRFAVGKGSNSWMKEQARTSIAANHLMPTFMLWRLDGQSVDARCVEGLGGHQLLPAAPGSHPGTNGRRPNRALPSEGPAPTLARGLPAGAGRGRGPGTTCTVTQCSQETVFGGTDTHKRKPRLSFLFLGWFLFR